MSSIPPARRNDCIHSIFGSHWLWLVLLGGVLMLAGAIAILVPAVSEIAAAKVLGSVLIISGLVQIVQATKMLHWTGFIWHLLLGILAAVGGALIYMDPFAGVVALTLLIAVIFAFHGVTQIGFAVKVRAQAGWHLVPGVGRHRPGRRRAAGDEAAVQPLLHARHRRRRVPAVRRLGLCRHGAGGADGRTGTRRVTSVEGASHVDREQGRAQRAEPRGAGDGAPHPPSGDLSARRRGVAQPAAPAARAARQDAHLRAGGSGARPAARPRRAARASRATPSNRGGASRSSPRR